MARRLEYDLDYEHDFEAARSEIMANNDPVVQRAYEIARTGKCSTIMQVRNQLAREGHPNGMGLLSDPGIADYLLDLMAERRRLKAASDTPGGLCRPS